MKGLEELKKLYIGNKIKYITLKDEEVYFPIVDVIENDYAKDDIWNRKGLAKATGICIVWQEVDGDENSTDGLDVCYVEKEKDYFIEKSMNEV